MRDPDTETTKKLGGSPSSVPLSPMSLPSLPPPNQTAEYDENAAKGMLQVLQSPGSSYSGAVIRTARSHSSSPSSPGKPIRAMKAPKAKPMKAMKAPKAKPMKAMKALKAKPMKVMKASNAKPGKSMKASKPKASTKVQKRPAGKSMKASKPTNAMKVKKRPAKKQLSTKRNCVYSRIYHSVYKGGKFGATKEQAWLLELPQFCRLRIPQISSPKFVDDLETSTPTRLIPGRLVQPRCWSCASSLAGPPKLRPIESDAGSSPQRWPIDKCCSGFCVLSVTLRKNVRC